MLSATQLNSCNTTIYNDYNGNITNANISASAAISLSKLGLTSTALDIITAGNAGWAVGISGDSVPRVSLNILTGNVGAAAWGPGGATAQDITLVRGAGPVLKVRNLANSADLGLTCLDLTASGTIAGNAVTSTTPIAPASGGTGVATTPTDGQLLVGKTSTSNYAVATLGTGTGISITAGSGTLQVNNTGVTSIVAGTGIQISGATGAVTVSAPGSNVLEQCRVSYTTAVPVQTSDVTAATTIYVMPYGGNTMTFANAGGTTETPQTFSQASVAIPSTTVTPFDIFASSASSTTITVTTVNWTNDTTRATALTYLNGRYVLSSDFTKTYVGTGRTTGVSGQSEDSTSKRFLFNAFNRTLKYTQAGDSTDSWTYTTATWRAANANTTAGQGRTEIVIGLSEDPVQATYTVIEANSVNAVVSAGIGIDSTSTNSAFVNVSPFSSSPGTAIGSYRGYPGTGYHYIQSLEISTASGTTTWYGDNGSTFSQSGQQAILRM